MEDFVQAFLNVDAIYMHSPSLRLSLKIGEKCRGELTCKTIENRGRVYLYMNGFGQIVSNDFVRHLTGNIEEFVINRNPTMGISEAMEAYPNIAFTFKKKTEFGHEKISIFQNKVSIRSVTFEILDKDEYIAMCKSKSAK